jgi:hypothetical protein
MFQRKAPDPQAAKILAAVRDETRPYTDPEATYGLAEKARIARAEGVARRGAA